MLECRNVRRVLEKGGLGLTASSHTASQNFEVCVPMSNNSEDSISVMSHLFHCDGSGSCLDSFRSYSKHVVAHDSFDN